MTDVAPSFAKVQQEAIQFNQPASEASQSSMGGLANALREVILPIGSIVDSMLDEALFQAQNNSGVTRWILADGRDVTGSGYQTLTGDSTVPDLRGVFRRGRNYARSGTTGDPSGDFVVGTYEADYFKSHNHNFNDPGHTHALTPQEVFFRPNDYADGTDHGAYDITGSTQEFIAGSSTGITFVAQGGNETRVRAVIVNTFIRIN